MNEINNDFQKNIKSAGLLILILISTSISSFSIAFMSSSINIAIPKIIKEFNINTVLASWITASYLLSTAVFSVPSGRIADIYGKKIIFLTGCIFFTVFSFLSGIVTSFYLFLILRILQGISSGMIFSTALALLTSNFSKQKRGLIIGINVFSVYIGLTTGPLLGGIITQTIGWRGIFFICAVFGLISSVLIIYLKEDVKKNTGQKFDFLGFLFFGMFLSFLMFGFSKLPSEDGLIFIISSLVSLAIFVSVELKVNSPLIDINFFIKNKVFLFSSLAALINYSATFGITFILSLYLQYNKNLNPLYAGLILVIQPLTQAIFAPVAGIVSDKVEPQILSSIGMLLTLIALLLIAGFQIETSFIFIGFVLFISGLGIALFSSPNTNAIMSSADKDMHGVASAIVSTMRLIGQTFSMGIILIIFNLIFSEAQLTKDNSFLLINSMNKIFSIFAVLCFLGILFSSIRGKIIKSQIL